MKRKIKVHLQVLFLAMATNLFSQAPSLSAPPSKQEKIKHECGSTTLLKNSLADNPGLAEQINKIVKENSKYSTNTVNSPPSSPFIIPVVFHIIRDPNNPTMVPDYNQVKMQLASLNAAFANSLNTLNNVPNGPQGTNALIQFCFAKRRQVGGVPSAWPTASVGVIYYNNSNQLTTNININNNASMATLPALTGANFPSGMYLNIWCVPNITTVGGATVYDPPAVIGVGAFPWGGSAFDGIIMRNDVIGNNTYGNYTGNMFAPLDKGNILVHEAGHYLGLFHTFETIVNNNINTAGGAAGCYGNTLPNSNGDLVFDTPPTQINGQIAPGSYNTCNETYAPYAGPADENDQIENFMSYIDDDHMNTLTYKQGERMWGALDNTWATTYLNGQRSNLVSAANLNATGVTLAPSCGPGLLNANFTPSLIPSSVTCSNAAFQFYQPILPGYLSATTHTWYFGDGNTSNAVNPSHTYNIAPYTFVVTLVVSDGVSTATTTMTINIPNGIPAIVGWSGQNNAVCRGSEQTILIRFPPYISTAILSDGTNNYVVNTNAIHNSSNPGFYVFPYTFTANASANYSLSLGSCNTSTTVASFTVVDCCNNMVVNGDMEAGPTGFTSGYVLTPNNYSNGNAGVGLPFGQFTCYGTSYGRILMIDAFGTNACNSPTLSKVIFAQNITGLQTGVDYYVAFKCGQSADSNTYMCANKFKMRVSWSGGDLINTNLRPTNYPGPSWVVPGGTGQCVWQVYSFRFTAPVCLPTTVFSLELTEIHNRNGMGFDYVFDNFTMRRMNGAIAVSPQTSSVCPGSPVQLNAVSNCSNIAGYNLVWQPQSSLSCGNCPNPIATPAVTTVYTLIAIPPITTPPSPNVVTTVTVFITQPPLSVNVVTLAACFPASYSLSANAVPTATWQPGNIVGTSIVVSPGSLTTYSASYFDPVSGCTSFTTITLNPPSQVSLAVGGNSVYCTNTPGAAVTATAFPLGSIATFTWLPGPLFGPSPVLTPSVNTVYTISATINGCPASATFAIQTVTMCCPPSTVAPLTQTFMTGNLINGPQMVLSDIVISSGVNTFMGGEFLMGPGVEITVMPGAELFLQGTHIYACGTNMWKGINVLDGGHVYLSSRGNVTMIEDAITAINLDNVTGAHWSPYPIEAYDALFNKNLVGIKVSNASVNNLNIIVQSCVFSSRNMAFTPVSWPNTSTALTDLRAAVNPTTDLAVPYSNLMSYPIANLKIPYTSQLGNVGVQVQNLGNVPNTGPFSGLDFGDPISTKNYNVFDALGVGVDASEASVSTRNNVFQNMQYFPNSIGQWFGGTGIKSVVTGQMNAALYLSPLAANYIPDLGNRFWECYTGVDGINVHTADITQAIFRSQHQQGMYGFLPGDGGIQMSTNRFNYNLSKNQINNIGTGINIRILGGSQSGIMAGNLFINENFISPEVSASNGIANQYVNNAIMVNGPNGAGWQTAAGAGMQINSNNIDRVFRGISVFGMDAHPTEINVNLISQVDDNMYGGPQYGIELLKTLDNVVISTNTLSSQNMNNQNINLVFCESNQSIGGLYSPVVLCNDASNAYAGFVFSGMNANTQWKGNYMTQLYRGMWLTNNGIIGMQGSPSSPSFNQWLGSWGGPFYTTYVDNGSNANMSVLWVNNVAPWLPNNNGGMPLANSYAAPGNIKIAKGGFDCLPLGNIPYPPVFKTVSQNNLTGIIAAQKNAWHLDLFPNPSSGKLSLESTNSSEQLKVRITNVSGKVLYENTHTTTNGSTSLEFDADNGIYFVEIVNDNNDKLVKKLIISK